MTEQKRERKRERKREQEQEWEQERKREQERSVTPNMMIPRRRSWSAKPARPASVEHYLSSRPITPATGRQSQMIGTLCIADGIFYSFYSCTLCALYSCR